jgi:hypothetical protein
MSEVKAAPAVPVTAVPLVLTVVVFKFSLKTIWKLRPADPLAAVVPSTANRRLAPSVDTLSVGDPLSVTSGRSINLMPFT